MVFLIFINLEFSLFSYTIIFLIYHRIILFFLLLKSFGAINELSICIISVKFLSHPVIEISQFHFTLLFCYYVIKLSFCHIFNL